MTIHGPDWPSVNLLREKLKDVEGEMRWGESGQSKLHQLQALSNGMFVPAFTTSKSVAIDWMHKGLKVWGRKKYHSHGSDIAIIPETKRWKSSDFWVCQVENVKDEWRIHVFNGKVIESQKKIWWGLPYSLCRHRRLAIECKVCEVIRSRRNGWRMSRQIKPNKEVKDVALAAVRVLGLLYSAVDVLECTDGSAVVLECNQAPAMDSRTCGRYAKAIRRWVSE